MTLAPLVPPCKVSICPKRRFYRHFSNSKVSMNPSMNPSMNLSSVDVSDGFRDGFRTLPGHFQN